MATVSSSVRDTASSMRFPCGPSEPERLRWEKKREEYIEAGIGPWQTGGGTGTLIETRDAPGGALDAEAIGRLIHDIFG